MCLNNPRIPLPLYTGFEDCGGPQETVCVIPSSSASVHAQDPQVVRARNARAISPYRAEPWPGEHHHLPCSPFWYIKKYLHCRAHSWEHQEKIQSRDKTVRFACFLSHFDSLKRIYYQIEPSDVGANFMSCLHDKAKMRYLPCSNANHQFPTRKQSPALVGTVKATNIPIEEPPRLHNILTLSNRSVAFSKCFLITILKYFSCK